MPDMLALVPVGRGLANGWALVSGETAMTAANAQHSQGKIALMRPFTSPRQTPTFPANEDVSLYGKATDSEYRQLHELSINDHCLINKGALIDSGLFTVMIQHSLMGHQALLPGNIRPSGPLAGFHRQDYACQWHLRNAPVSGPALRQRAFLTPGFHLESVRPVPVIGRRAGIATRKGASCTYRQFLRPVRFPAPKPGYFPIPGDKPVANSDVSTPRELAFYSHHLERLRNAAYGINAITCIAREMNVLGCSEELPDWWNGWTEGGLLSAIQEFGSGISDTLEFLQQRAEEQRTGEKTDAQH